MPLTKLEREAIRTTIYGVGVVTACTAAVLVGYLAVKTFLLGI